MTPKEKAKELMQKAYYLDQHNKTTQSRCKQIALLCVDEKIKTGIDLNGEMFSGFIEGLQEIKQEINKL
jgi:hypothetical protein